MKSINRTGGTYWRLAWSTCWKDRHPWAINGELLPYVGKTKVSGMTVWTIGPVALMAVTVSPKKEISNDHT